LVRVSIVEESVSAYRVCKERIDAVEKALEKALTDVGADVTPPAATEGLQICEDFGNVHQFSGRSKQ
jgi:hypothetical protein